MFPKVKCDFPRDASGNVVPGKLSDEVLSEFQGVLGHYHIQSNKVDPGPAFQWEKVINGARGLMAPSEASVLKKPAERTMESRP